MYGILGIRPEHLELTPTGPGTLLLTIDQVGVLGADTLVHAHVGEGKIAITTRLPDVHRLEKDATIPLTVSHEKLHFFDAETKQRIG